MRHAVSHGSLSIGFMSALMQKVTCKGLGDLCAIRAACRFDRDTQPYIAVERATSTRSTPSGRAVFSLYWQEVEQTGAVLGCRSPRFIKTESMISLTETCSLRSLIYYSCYYHYYRFYYVLLIFTFCEGGRGLPLVSSASSAPCGCCGR